MIGSGQRDAADAHEARRSGFAGRRGPGSASRARRWALALALCGLAATETGCFAFLRSRAVGRTCTPDAARAAGRADAEAGRERNDAYAAICGVEEAYLNGVYTEAYAEHSGASQP